MKLFTFITFLIYVSALQALAQIVQNEEKKEIENMGVKVTYAELVCGSEGKQQLNVMLDQSFEFLQTAGISDDNSAAANYRIIQLSNGSIFELTVPSIGTTLKNTVSMSLSRGLNLGAEKIGFGLVANNTVKDEGSKKVVSSLTKIKISDICNNPPEKLPEPPDETVKKSRKFADYFAKAESDEKAKVVLKSSIDGSKTTRRYFTNDFDFRPVRIRRLGLAGAYDLIPFYLKLRYSGDPRSPVDQFEFGTKIIHHRIFNDDGERISDWKEHTQVLTGITTTLNPFIESDWRFKEVNVVFGWKTGLPFNLIQTRSRSLRVTPYVGFEFGSKIKSEDKTSKGNILARPLIGGELYFTPYRTEEKKPFVFEVAYIRRFYLKPELSYVINEIGKEIPNGLSQLPREHGTAKLTFNYNGLISPFLEYYYGREPTKYILVNSRYRAGIQMSFDWKK